MYDQTTYDSLASLFELIVQLKVKLFYNHWFEQNALQAPYIIYIKLFFFKHYKTSFEHWYCKTKHSMEQELDEQFTLH